jgi:hypothetical protein
MDDFDSFIRKAWNEHADAPEAVAARLDASRHLVQTAKQVAPYASLLVHVYGVHLAQWAQGEAQLAALRGTAGYDATAHAEGPIARGIAALAIASGRSEIADTLTVPDRAAALAQAAAALLDREETEPGSIDRAMTLFATSDALASRTTLPDDAPAIRSLAVGGNNLASALEERTDRTPAQTEAMVHAAKTGLACWQRCGGWLEHERAEYRMARSLLQARRATEAATHARECVRICTDHDAPAIERFFGHVVEALALHAAGQAQGSAAARTLALDAYEAVPVDERRWCADDLRELQSVGSPAT